jgi:hypothetical protein
MDSFVRGWHGWAFDKQEWIQCTTDRKIPTYERKGSNSHVMDKHEFFFDRQ